MRRQIGLDHVYVHAVSCGLFVKFCHYETSFVQLPFKPLGVIFCIFEARKGFVAQTCTYINVKTEKKDLNILVHSRSTKKTNLDDHMGFFEQTALAFICYF